MSLSTTDRPEALATSLELPPSDADPTSTGQDSVASITSDAATIRPTFTITDAATACSVSRKTITRKLPELAGHGAAKDDDGVWRIPVEALLAVGLHPGRSLPQVASAPVRPLAPPPSHARPADPETVTIPRDRWDDVRIRLARAEAEASERGLALADARLALRALTAGPLPSPAAPRTPEEPVAGTESGWQEAAGLHGGPGPRRLSPEFGAPVLGRDESPTAAPGDTTVPDPDIPGPAGSGGPAATGAEPALGAVVAARNLAARTGGYVPAVAAPARKRRWWQSH